MDLRTSRNICVHPWGQRRDGLVPPMLPRRTVTTPKARHDGPLGQLICSHTSQGSAVRVRQRPYESRRVEPLSPKPAHRSRVMLGGWAR